MQDQPRIRICVVGAGAIGGYFAARLAAAGNDVSVLARGPVLAAVLEHGVRLESGGEQIAAPVRASADAADLGIQDIVVIAVKSPALASVARVIAPLLGPDTVVIPALNGIPWWYFLGPGQPLEGKRLHSVDPSAEIESGIPLERVVGTVVVVSCYSPEPGRVVQAAGNKVLFGEPSGGYSERVEKVAALFKAAGIDGGASPDIRRDIWVKLLGNACFNPVSMITGSHSDDLLEDAGLIRLFTGMMTEMLTLSRTLGIDVQMDPAARLAQTRQLGHVKTSMLQDLEAGRQVELDSIIGAVVECAGAIGVPVPLLDTVYALARQRGRELNIYAG